MLFPPMGNLTGFSILFSTFDLPNPNDDQIRRYQEAR